MGVVFALIVTFSGGGFAGLVGSILRVGPLRPEKR